MEKINLGEFNLCLKVKDVYKSVEFYQKLEFRHTNGDLKEGWAIMQNENLIIGLFQGHIEPMVLLNFRKGDIYKIEAQLKTRGLTMSSPAFKEPDGSIGATLKDPDGHIIYFNTHTDET